MAIRPVLRMGDARLLEIARPVAPAEFGSPQLRALVADLEETMAHLDGAGLAAPQIGVGLRVVVFGSTDDHNPRYPEAPSVPYTVLINPVLAPLGDEVEKAWEGCLSLPGLRGCVPRWRALRYTGFDVSGQPIDRRVEGFHARVVQHECDHLDGILYPRRIDDLRFFGFADQLEMARDTGQAGD